MIPKSWWLSGLAGLVIVTAIPVVGHLIRGDREGRCAWDGLKIEPIYQVRIVEKPGITDQFCCLQCAEFWLERRGRKPIDIFVTDESSGMEIEASDAFYVRSAVATNPVTGDHRHVFRAFEDAKKHAESAHGRQLLGDERPFEKKRLTDSGNPQKTGR